MNDLEAFAKLVIALEPWKGQIVFAGGWAYRLFRHHPMAVVPSYGALFTRDADIALSDKETFDGNIKTALVNAGFHEELSSEFKPPVSKYMLGREQAGFYAEFLTMLRGSGRKRTGEFDATKAMAGITAQKLRHLDLLLIAPWEVSLGVDATLPEALDRLQIPNPVSFIVQKLLVHDERKDKKPQDVLYIHDTLELFGANSEVLADLWKNEVTRYLSEKEVARVNQIRHEMFDAINDTLRDAARIPSDRNLVPEEMQLLCDAILSEIFE